MIILAQENGIAVSSFPDRLGTTRINIFIYIIYQLLS